MKGFKFILGVGIIFLLGSLAVVAISLKEDIKVKKILNIKEKKLKDIIRASTEMVNLQKNIFNQRIEELRIEESIPTDEKHNADLIMSLSAISQRAGFENIKFIYGNKSGNQDDMTMAGSSSSNEGEMANSSFLGEASGEDDTSSVKTNTITLEGEIEFQLIFSFLEEILNLRRLLTIESIDINQSSKISSMQNVQITVIYYSFKE